MSPIFISLLYFGQSLGQMEVYNGSLSKPDLQALPAPVVPPGTDVTFLCSLPPDSYPQPMIFILQKDQNEEPLQYKIGEWKKADFLIFSVRPQDTGNYSCIYHQNRDSYRVSEPSETLELWVTEILPKPFISGIPSQLVVSGGNVTLRCWGPIRGMRFVLYKEGEEGFVGIRDSTQGEAEFHLTHVDINNMGYYSCRYDLGPDSHVLTLFSDLLELRVQSEEQRKKDSLEGRLSKPYLQVLQALVVAPGTDMIFFCGLPPTSYPQAVTFILHKTEDQEPVDIKPGERAKVDFLILSAGPQDSGNYSCSYHVTADSSRISEPSETVEIWVTETLPKPFISASPSQLVVSGGNVTLQCWGSIRGVRFALHKEGEERCVRIRESTQDGAEFHLTHVNIKNKGNYSCHYDLGAESHVLTSPSDLLELILQISRYILITLRHVFIVFLFLLLAYEGHQYTRLVSLKGNKYWGETWDLSFHMH
ncbi:immunoglobulin superfamily member 1-like isoform X2 [Macrotis lagotis]|uniref:immunoglobulin superfamily member 1-like isoform X2 n=1 Tax=Macrotis lagotis TaxID=92651 RepID=UPI003D680BCC